MADNRDEENLKHFKARAQQAKVPVDNAPPRGEASPSPVNITLVFDSNFGSVSDEMEGARFRYMGVSPTVSMYNRTCARRLGQQVMSSFKY